jgi:HNH endonuclease
MLNGVLGKLLQEQGVKCRWCGLLFQDGDIIEIDHVIPKSRGGGEEHSNKCALHRHCHDQRHTQRVQGTHDKGFITEEPDDANVSRSVLKPSGGGNPFALVNLHQYQTFEEARANLQRFLEDVYNAKRLHSLLDYVPPDDFGLNTRGVNVLVVWTFWWHCTDKLSNELSIVLCRRHKYLFKQGEETMQR